MDAPPLDPSAPVQPAAAPSAAAAPPIRMQDPSGKWFDVPPESLQAALSNGWKGAHEAQQEQAVREEASKASGLGVFGHHLANEASFGVVEHEQDRGESARDQAFNQAVREQELKEHPIAGYAGKALGFLAPMLIPGVGEAGEAARLGVEGVAKGAAELGLGAIEKQAVKAGVKGAGVAAEASLAKKVAASAAKYATEGAIYSAPNAAVQATYGDPEQAAETMLWGIGLGGVLGGAGRLAGEVGAKAASKAAGSKIGAEAAGKLLDAHYTKLEGALSDAEVAKLAPSGSEASAAFRKELEANPDIGPELMSNKSGRQHVMDLNQHLIDVGNERSFTKLEAARKKILQTGKDLEEGSLEKELTGLAHNIVAKHIDQAAGAVYATGALKQEYPAFLTAKNAYLGAVAGPKAVAAVVAKDYLKTFAMNSLMENRAGLLEKGVGFLRDYTAAPMLGGLMAKEGASSLQAHLDRIPSILTNGTAVTRSAAALNAAAHVLGSTTGLSTQQQYDKLTKTIQQAAVDLSSTASAVGGQASAFTSHNAQLGALVMQKQLGALNYLAAQIPKGPPPKPFVREDWKPTKQQQAQFIEKVAIVNDPMSVWKKYQEGSLGKTEAQTLQAVYPKLYKAMAEKITQTAFDPREPPLSFHQRMQLSAFTGQPMDSSVKNLASIQQALAAPAQQASSGSHAQPRKTPITGARSTQREPKYVHMPDYQTGVERRSNA